MDLVDFGLEPVVTDSRYNEAPQAAVEHVLNAKRDKTKEKQNAKEINKRNRKC